MSTHGGNWNGKALELHRTRAGMSLQDVRDKLAEFGYGLALSTVARWEKAREDKGRIPSNPAYVESLARIFGCSVIAFYREPILTYDAAKEDTD